MFSSKKQLKEIGWFRNALYLFLVYKVLIYCTQFDELFSEHNLIYNCPKHTGFINDLAYELTNHYSVRNSSICVIIVFVMAMIGLLKKSNLVTNLVLWITIVNLNNYLYPTLTSGDYLLNQLLLGNAFFSVKKSANPFVQDVKTILHNMALIGIKTQICIAYVVAGIFKLNDPYWLDGSAISHIIQIPEYSNSFLLSLPVFVCTLMTYLTVIYQLSFPITMLVRPLKKYAFMVGIMQHLLIAIAMGLFSFGIIMIISYLLFLEYDTGDKNH